MLKIKNLNVVRTGGLQVLWDVSIEVERSETVAVIGPNGAGKTTLLSTITRFIKPLSGRIYFREKDITSLPSYKNVNLGISFVPEDMKLFGNCTVKENLILGAYSLKTKSKIKAMMDLVYEIFPVLRDRENQLCLTLSGGEQRMLAIARGLMASPELLILDEPSQGLSPRMVAQVFKTIESLKAKGLTILLVEQNVHHALRVADRAYIMETGRITMEGEAQRLLKDEYVKEAFLGL